LEFGGGGFEQPPLGTPLIVTYATGMYLWVSDYKAMLNVDAGRKICTLTQQTCTLAPTANFSNL